MTAWTPEWAPGRGTGRMFHGKRRPPPGTVHWAWPHQQGFEGARSQAAAGPARPLRSPEIARSLGPVLRVRANRASRWARPPVLAAIPSAGSWPLPCIRAAPRSGTLLPARNQPRPCSGPTRWPHPGAIAWILLDSDARPTPEHRAPPASGRPSALPRTAASAHSGPAEWATPSGPPSWHSPRPFRAPPSRPTLLAHARAQLRSLEPALGLEPRAQVSARAVAVAREFVTAQRRRALVHVKHRTADASFTGHAGHHPERATSGRKVPTALLAHPN